MDYRLASLSGMTFKCDESLNSRIYLPPFRAYTRFALHGSLLCSVSPEGGKFLNIQWLSSCPLWVKDVRFILRSSNYYGERMDRKEAFKDPWLFQIGANLISIFFIKHDNLKQILIIISYSLKISYNKSLADC